MKRIIFSLFACIVVCALASQSAPAAAGFARVAVAPAAAPAATRPQQPAHAPRSVRHGRARALSHALRKEHRDRFGERIVPVPKPIIVRIVSHDGAAAQRAAARDQVERNARADRLYRSSQVSAPIITNATACKRIGAHGESIYENCQTATAAMGSGEL